MYTSLGLVALLGFYIPTPREPNWMGDYFQAQEKGVQEKKPLAVFVGAGEKGHQHISDSARRLLSSHYICVYVDSKTNEGRKLAGALHVFHEKGLVISDRSGSWQAFRHNGELGEQQLTHYLQVLADPEREVRQTLTHQEATVRPVSYSPPVVRNC